MPRTRVVFFKETDGSVPVVEWLDGLAPKAQVKCVAKLKRLEDLGHELRLPRPTCFGMGSTNSVSGSKG